MIIKDKNKLKDKCLNVSIEEGEEIGAQLLKELSDSGVGLAANQIGINKRVCVINVKEPIVLINPKIVETSEDMFAFAEGCLSFPNTMVKTMRYKQIVVEADNHKNKLLFDYSSPSDKPEDLTNAHECACVQHEIDHLDGITMFDREYKQQPWKRKTPKIGRNQKVTISDGTESKVIKYKKAQPLLENGWTLVES